MTSRVQWLPASRRTVSDFTRNDGPGQPSDGGADWLLPKDLMFREWLNNLSHMSNLSLIPEHILAHFFYDGLITYNTRTSSRILFSVSVSSSLFRI